MRFPDGVGDLLEQSLFRRAVPAERRMRLDDPMHALRARYPEELDLPPEVRLVSGVVPFGYLDHVRRRVVHVAAPGDPAAAFLRFAARVAAAGSAETVRLTGAGPADLALDDPDRLVPQLLELPRVRLRCVGAMTRLCAGLPWRASDLAPVEHLRAAQANLRRIDFLAAPDSALDGFAAYLSRVFGWPAPAPCDVVRLRAPLVEAEALGAAARRALDAATATDRQLLEIVEARVGPELSGRASTLP
jgi:hypothetical protein